MRAAFHCAILLGLAQDREEVGREERTRPVMLQRRDAEKRFLVFRATYSGVGVGR
jgi:hypothetical protein